MRVWCGLEGLVYVGEGGGNGDREFWASCIRIVHSSAVRSVACMQITYHDFQNITVPRREGNLVPTRRENTRPWPSPLTSPRALVSRHHICAAMYSKASPIPLISLHTLAYRIPPICQIPGTSHITVSFHTHTPPTHIPHFVSFRFNRTRAFQESKDTGCGPCHTALPNRGDDLTPRFQRCKTTVSLKICRAAGVKLYLVMESFGSQGPRLALRAGLDRAGACVVLSGRRALASRIEFVMYGMGRRSELRCEDWVRVTGGMLEV